MSTLLYVSASPKEEKQSACKTVARMFIDKWIKDSDGYQITELDLYKEDIPLLNQRHVMGRATLSKDEDFNRLTDEEKKQVKRIEELCDQFISADRYIIAAPMWSIFFPAILKQYLDCVIINGKTIKINNKEVEGLLGDKERHMLYIQSSGGIYPKILNRKLNHGLTYLKDVFKFLGVEKFQKILVEGLDMNEVGWDKALQQAKSDIAKSVDLF